MTARPCDQLLDYAYGELSGDAKAQFESHLATCESCPAELSSISKVRSAAKTALAAEESPRRTGALQATLMAEAEKGMSDIARARGKQRGWLSTLMRHPGYAAAASLLLVGGTVALMSRLGTLDLPHAALEPAPRPPAAQTMGPPMAKQLAEQAAAQESGLGQSVDKKTREHLQAELDSARPASSTVAAAPGRRADKNVPLEESGARSAPMKKGAAHADRVFDPDSNDLARDSEKDEVVKVSPAKPEMAKKAMAHGAAPAAPRMAADVGDALAGIESKPATGRQRAASPASAEPSGNAFAAAAAPPPSVLAAEPPPPTSASRGKATRAKKRKCEAGDDNAVSAQLAYVHCLRDTGSIDAARGVLQHLKPRLSAVDFAEEDRLLRAATPVTP